MNSPRPSVSRSRSGFTLVELLVVIAIIAVLASLLFPVMTSMKRAGNATKCAGQLRQLGVALTSYSSENDGQAMGAGADGPNLNAGTWFQAIGPYLTAAMDNNAAKQAAMNNAYSKVLFCPEYYTFDRRNGKATAEANRYKNGTWWTGFVMNEKPGYNEGKPDHNDKSNRMRADGPGGSRPSWTEDFRMASITHKSLRPYILDGNEWQTGAIVTDTAASHIDFHRHGTNKCNVLYFDMHVETSDFLTIQKALRWPWKIEDGVK